MNSQEEEEGIRERSTKKKEKGEISCKSERRGGEGRRGGG